MDVRPVTLTGATVVVEPLEERHAADLAAGTPRGTFDYFFPPLPATYDEAGFRAMIRAIREVAWRTPFALVDRASGRAVGSSSYLEVLPAHRGLEIGFTWIAPGFRGTHVNPGAKLLLLSHAFDDQGAERVQLKCDARNLHSARAIEKLGAVREGVLRRNRVCPDGHVRDTVMFSILRAEWPGVRAGLEARLARLSPVRTRAGAS